MKFHRIVLVPCLAASLFLSSCATKLSSAQRAELSTVAVAGTTVDPDAYEDPYGGDTASRDAVASQGLIGLAVGSAISGTQNNMFKGKNQSYFTAVKKNTPADLGNMLNRRLKESLAGDPFFKSRLAAKSGNSFTSEITTHRLVRAGKNDNGDLLFAPEVYVEIHLKNAAGKVLAGRSYRGTGTGGLTVAEYAASAPRTKAAYSIAVDNAVTAFMADLALKTAE